MKSTADLARVLRLTFAFGNLEDASSLRLSYIFSCEEESSSTILFSLELGDFKIENGVFVILFEAGYIESARVGLV